MIPAHANNEMRAYLVLRPPFVRGLKRMGNRSSAVAAPGSVSVNTTVITYVPAGVVEDVVTINVPVADE
jgi:hypothetical protein